MPLVMTGSKGQSAGILQGFALNIPEIDLKKL
jgi:hypothetical protein